MILLFRAVHDNERRLLQERAGVVQLSKSSFRTERRTRARGRQRAFHRSHG